MRVDGPHKTQYARHHATYLFGTGVVQGTLFEQPAAVVDLDDVSVTAEFSTASLFDVHLTGVLGESPLGTLQNLLAAGKLEFTTTDRLDDVDLGRVFRADTQQDLSDVDAGSDANGLSVRMPHSGRQPIGPGARKHLVGAKDVEGMGPDADVVRVLSDHFREMLVDGNPAGLEGFARNLLLLVADQVGDEGEEIDGSLLVADVEDLDLGFRYTTAVPRLDVRLVLLVSVATSWTATHGEI